MPIARPALRDALAGSACLGTWTYDALGDRFRASPSLAVVFGTAPAAARRGTALAVATAAVHEDDRERVEILLRAVADEAGPFEAEFRVATGRTGLRWLRLMGRFDHRTGTAHGLAFDLTEGRAAGAGSARQVQARVNRLAGHAIAMKGLVAGLPNRPLALAVDRVAVEIGFELARHLRAKNEPRH